MKEPTQYRRELKDKIVECATRMFLKHGVRSVKMDDIASHLSISKRTLYELFGNKEELLHAVVAEKHAMNRQWYEQLSRSATNVMDILIGEIRMRMQQVDEVNPLFFSDMSAYPSVVSLVNRHREQRMLHSREFLERGVREGFFLPGVDYNLVCRIMDSVIYSTLVSKHNDVDMQGLFHVSILLFIRSICTKQGLMVLDPVLSEMKGGKAS